MISPEQFFDLLLKELEIHTEMQPYYKFLGDEGSFDFRRNYFIQRLQYIFDQVKSGKNGKIIDCGCGYGTTCIFLALNGYASHGTTLEFYFDAINKRKEYYSKFGDTSLFTCSYENLFDQPLPVNTYDIIIVQDTLHHLEPINDALKIFYNALVSGGKLISIEENGNNIIQSIKLYKYRGNKRIITFYDEKLKKNILLGNENIRSLNAWSKLFASSGFVIDLSTINYIRYYLPFQYKNNNPKELLKREQEIQNKADWRREYFFFGLNFVALKK